MKRRPAAAPKRRPAAAPKRRPAPRQRPAAAPSASLTSTNSLSAQSIGDVLKSIPTWREAKDDGCSMPCRLAYNVSAHFETLNITPIQAQALIDEILDQEATRIRSRLSCEATNIVHAMAIRFQMEWPNLMVDWLKELKWVHDAI